MGLIDILDKFDEKVNKMEQAYDNKTGKLRDKIDEIEQGANDQTDKIIIIGYSAVKYALKGTKEGLKAVKSGRKFKDEFKENFKEEYIQEDIKRILAKVNETSKKQNPFVVAKTPIKVLKKK